MAMCHPAWFSNSRAVKAKDNDMRWEYKTIDVPTSNWRNLGEVLNAEGEQGWELAALVPADGAPGGPAAVLKRVIPMTGHQ